LVHDLIWIKEGVRYRGYGYFQLGKEFP
jgi:hypothetical protein